MGFGGPVWHASVKQRQTHVLFRPETIAREVLEGVGDATLGEWTEQGGAFHLRRRLTAAEAEDIGQVCDIRGTDEARNRVRALRFAVAPGVLAWAEHEAEGRT